MRVFRFRIRINRASKRRERNINHHIVPETRTFLRELTSRQHFTSSRKSANSQFARSISRKGDSQSRASSCTTTASSSTRECIFFFPVQKSSIFLAARDRDPAKFPSNARGAVPSRAERSEARASSSPAAIFSLEPSSEPHRSFYVPEEVS